MVRIFLLARRGDGVHVDRYARDGTCSKILRRPRKTRPTWRSDNSLQAVTHGETSRRSNQRISPNAIFCTTIGKYCLRNCQNFPPPSPHFLIVNVLAAGSPGDNTRGGVLMPRCCCGGMSYKHPVAARLTGPTDPTDRPKQSHRAKNSIPAADLRPPALRTGSRRR